MAINLAAFSSSASIGTTERSMPSDTTSGVPVSRTDTAVYQLSLDLSALAAGDQFQVKIYEKVASGGTQRAVETYVFTGAQANPHVFFPTLILGVGWDMTLKKLAGTDRTIGWAIRSA
jgi:hypothetical protein